MAQMKTSDKGKRLIFVSEGMVTKVYNDSGGRPTIGVGHLLTDPELHTGTVIVNQRSIPFEQGLTQDQCYSLLEQDLAKPERVINENALVELSQNQFDALVSFVFNVGNNAFLNSTLLKMLNLGLYHDVPAQLRRWNKDNGAIVKGLSNRRRAEIKLWNTA